MRFTRASWGSIAAIAIRRWKAANFAAIPPTETCMNCHTNIRTQSDKLQPIRDSWATGKPMEWIKIHDLPQYVYFSHQAHVNHGVGCIECHGRIDQMEQVYQAKPLSMGWCLDCHRDPGSHLRPKTVAVTDMNWTPPADPTDAANAGGTVFEGIFDSRHGVHAELFDVSSVTKMKHHSAQRDYWRSLAHLANAPEVQAAAEKEFASYEPDELLKMTGVTRRRFMKLMSASMALAGLTLTGCRRWPQEKLAPYTSNPGESHAGRSRAICDGDGNQRRRQPAAGDEL